MDCPVCGSNVGGVSLLVGIVRIASFACPCGRHWRLRTFVGEPTIHDVTNALEGLLKRYPGPRSDSVKHAIIFLETKQASMAAAHAGKSKAIRERAADAWERKFLRDAIGEDI